jgi:hypothetical protein
VVKVKGGREKRRDNSASLEQKRVKKSECPMLWRLRLHMTVISSPSPCVLFDLLPGTENKTSLKGIPALYFFSLLLR